MSDTTRRFLDLLESTGLTSRLPGIEPDIAAIMDADLLEVKAWLHGAPMSERELAIFEQALPSLTRGLRAPPAGGGRRTAQRTA